MALCHEQIKYIKQLLLQNGLNGSVPCRGSRLTKTLYTHMFFGYRFISSCGRNWLYVGYLLSVG